MITEALLLRATMEAVAFLNAGMAEFRVRDCAWLRGLGFGVWGLRASAYRFFSNLDSRSQLFAL